MRDKLKMAVSPFLDIIMQNNVVHIIEKVKRKRSLCKLFQYNTSQQRRI
jgi:hypothetical protein